MKRIIIRLIHGLYPDLLMLSKTGKSSVFYDVDGVKWTAFVRKRNKFGKNKKK